MNDLAESIMKYMRVRAHNDKQTQRGGSAKSNGVPEGITDGEEEKEKNEASGEGEGGRNERRSKGIECHLQAVPPSALTTGARRKMSFDF